MEQKQNVLYMAGLTLGIEEDDLVTILEASNTLALNPDLKEKISELLVKPEPEYPRKAKYFEVWVKRDPAVGIPDVYEKVTFESGFDFETAEDLEDEREFLVNCLGDYYGGFTPEILFDFEPHDYYKPVICPDCHSNNVEDFKPDNYFLETKDKPDFTHNCLECKLYFTLGAVSDHGVKATLYHWHEGHKMADPFYIPDLQQWIEDHGGVVMAYPPNKEYDHWRLIITDKSNRFIQR